MSDKNRMSSTPSKRHFEAIAKRSGKWWFVHIPELDTGGQARNIGEVDEVAREIAGLWLDVDPDDLEVAVTVVVPEDIRAEWARAEEIEAAVRVQVQTAAALKRQAVADLRAEGYTLDAAARAFNISKQRVHQLAHQD